VPICASCGRESEGRFAFCPHCGALLRAVPRAGEQRKTVTVLFCDVTGSTALGEAVDPEVVRALLARYFEQMKAIVERHGGTVRAASVPGRTGFTIALPLQPPASSLRPV
jgi:Adenylate and Guanylate cyclase catalytic domain